MVSQQAFPKKHNAFHLDLSLWEADVLLRETCFKGACMVSLQPCTPQISLPSFQGSSYEDEQWLQDFLWCPVSISVSAKIFSTTYSQVKVLRIKLQQVLYVTKGDYTCLS